MCSAIAGSTTVSERPWVTSSGTPRSRSTSSSSISRAPRLARTCGATAMFQHSAVSKSSAATGLARHARTKPRMPRILAGRSSAVASAKWSRKPGPISVPNAASPSLTAPSTKLTAATRSWPYARR